MFKAERRRHGGHDHRHPPRTLQISANISIPPFQSQPSSQLAGQETYNKSTPPPNGELLTAPKNDSRAPPNKESHPSPNNGSQPAPNDNNKFRSPYLF
ncbi:hypothetical protein PtA15_1A573 [Puccinia triticina]|uniref:Uncharacterized protein n=1 Tax=Puccinia triticina TaxID=208348 RepID=A0ABY7C7T8_9BASI|nr:uncharacterized protein PtA15_1A573 [Puccinia triticina]WAQ81233.1 hypothetical protein PtA15_1A573 [Puccinia triticina]